MKTAMVMSFMLALAVVSGCQTSSQKGGSVQKGKGFTIAVPTFATEIKQGQIQSVAISLIRGDYFKQDVKLQITAPAGLSVDPDSLTIKASEKAEVQLRVAAASNAALGDYRIAVKGVPKTGESTMTVFIVKVAAP